MIVRIERDNQKNGWREEKGKDTMIKKGRKIDGNR